MGDGLGRSREFSKKNDLSHQATDAPRVHRRTAAPWKAVVDCAQGTRSTVLTARRAPRTAPKLKLKGDRCPYVSGSAPTSVGGITALMSERCSAAAGVAVASRSRRAVAARGGLGRHFEYAWLVYASGEAPPPNRSRTPFKRTWAEVSA